MPTAGDSGDCENECGSTLGRQGRRPAGRLPPPGMLPGYLSAECHKPWVQVYGKLTHEDTP